MFDIIFDQSLDEPFTPGSKVSGNLVVKKWKYSIPAAIHIRLYGHVKVLWQESVKNPDGSGSELKLNHHKELNFLTLEGKPIMHSWYEELEPGQRFAFRFKLPEDKPMPSSHAGGHKFSLSYYVDALINVSSETEDGMLAPISARAPVPFSETVDINSPAMLAPIVRQQEEHIYHWYSKKPSGTVTVTVEIPHTGYHLGESIPFTATVKNDTGSQIKMEALLLQTVSYLHAVDEYTDKTFVLVNYPEAQMPPKITSVWSPAGVRNHEFKLDVTKTELVSSTCLEYIKVRHQLEVTASLPSNKTIKFAIPITIGNVPRKESDATASAIASEKLEFGASAPPPEKIQPRPYQPDEKPEASPGVGWSGDLTPANGAAVTSTRKHNDDQSGPVHQAPTELTTGLTTEAPPTYEVAKTLD